MDAPLPPSSAPAEPDGRAEGRLIGGRYRLERRIASGGMASVWQGMDEVLARPVAVKLLHPHLAADEQFVARFRREAVAAARLSHPSIVSIFDTCSASGSGPEGHTEAIVMELVRGPTLRAELDRRGRFEPADAAAVVAEIADALSAAHAAGIVHRDVKPANVLLSSDGRVLVADFGIAKAGDGLELTGDGTTLGTAKYLSPEQVQGHPVDGRADVYAAGVILYELVCGRPPFVADTEAATALARLHRDPEPPRSVRPDLPAALEAVILGALARDPAQRIGSAAELRDALRGGRRPSTTGTGVVPAIPGLVDPTTFVDATTAAPSWPAPAQAPHPLPAAPPPPRGRPRAPQPPASPAQPSQRRRRWGLAVTLGLVFTSAGVALALFLGAGDDSNDRFNRPGNGGEGGGESLAIAGITSFDPDGDGEERDGLLDAATDGDDETAWQSECYSSAAFGNLKDGVGLIVELGGSGPIDVLDVLSPGGWSAEAYVANEAGASLVDWGEPVAVVEGAGDSTTSIELGGAEGRFVLLFFTSLGEVGGCEFPFGVTVNELTLR